MVKKFNLSEAAADILNKSVAAGRSRGDMSSQRLTTSIVPGQKEVGDIGTEVTKTTDGAPQATKGAPTATPPGATPPVGAEPMKKLQKQPGEDKAAEEDDPEGKPGKQMMQKNPGATFQSYGGQHEEVELEYEDVDAIVEKLQPELLDQLTEEDLDILESLDDERLEAINELSSDHVLAYARAAGKDAGKSLVRGKLGRLVKRAKGLKKAANIYGSKSNERGQFTSKYGTSHDTRVDNLSQLAGHTKFRKEDIDYGVDISEDIDALLEGEELSEDFVKKATTIFEAAVLTRVEELAEEVEARLQEQFDSALEEVKEDFANKIDDYLNYMVEEWMKENELAIESGLRSEIVEDFMKGLHNLFTEHYIDIPEEKVDVVEELASKVEELEEKLNEEISKNVEVSKELKEQKKFMAVQTACEGLTQTQAEKLKALAENVKFTSEDEFAQKLEQLKEAYAPTSQVKPAEKAVLEEGVDIEETKPQHVSHDPMVDAVAKSISKFSVK